MLKRSIVLTALVPEAVNTPDAFKQGVLRFKELGIDTIEYYAPSVLTEEYGLFLEQNGMGSIYLIAGYQKKHGVNLSAVSESERTASVRTTYSMLNAAKRAGASTALITSGSIPKDTRMETQAWKALVISLCEIMEYAADEINVVMEIGDKNVDAMQLAGSVEDCVAFTEALQERYPRFSLTMDTSHIAQLGDMLIPALEKATDVCSHVHFANCVLHKGHTLYGDKHPKLDHPEGYFQANELRDAFAYVINSYSKHDVLTCGLEVIWRENDPLLSRIHTLCRQAPWFFNKQ